MARDAALAGAGVAGIAGAAVLTRKGSKAIAGLAKRGRAAIRSGVKSGKGTLDTAKDVLEKNVRPVFQDAKVSTGHAAAAAPIYGDVGRAYKDLKGIGNGELKSQVKGAFREGVAEGAANPRKNSAASRAGRLAKKIGFERPYDKDSAFIIQDSSRFELSSFVADVQLANLPREMRKTVSAFGATKTSKMPRYGMVVKELVAKADAHNLDAARKHVKTMSEPRLSDEFEAKRGKKFILLLNDQIIDGHHWLAKAEKLGITSALDVLDLTPVRFQVEVQELEALMASTNFAAPVDDGKHERVKNALLYGTGGAYMGGLLAGGKPLRVPVPSKLIKKIGGRAGKGAWKKVSVNAARAGAAAGLASGLIMNPKKRKRGGVGDAIAEHAPGLVTATQAFSAKGARTLLSASSIPAGKSARAPFQKRKSKCKVEPVTMTSQFEAVCRMPLHLFGDEDQPVDKRSGRKMSHIGGFMDPDNARRFKRDGAGAIVKTKDGRAVYETIKGIPGASLIGSAHRAAAPVVKWGGRGKAIVKDAIGAAKGEVKKDSAGRVQKREWEKPWAQNAAKKVAVGGGLLAYAAGVRHNTKLPIPSRLVSAVTKGKAKVSKGMFTKVGMRDIHRGATNAVHKAMNATFASQLDEMITKLEALSMRQIERTAGTPARMSERTGVSALLSEFGYNDARDEGWDLRDPRGKSARVFAPGSQKRERREKKWHEKIGNERKLWGAGLIAASLAGGAVGRKLTKPRGGVAVHAGGNGSFTTSAGFRSNGRSVTSSLR